MKAYLINTTDGQKLLCRRASSDELHATLAAHGYTDYAITELLPGQDKTLLTLIQDKGLSVRALADDIPCSPRTLEAYTTGRRNLQDASARLYLGIAAALGLDPYWLLGIVSPDTAVLD